jgi:hypothetical protein
MCTAKIEAIGRHLILLDAEGEVSFGGRREAGKHTFLTATSKFEYSARMLSTS